MSGLDLNLVKQAEQEIKARRAGAGNFVRLEKGESKDIRILEPTPAMNGLYWIEVPIWWVNGKPITSPEFLGEGDFVQEVIDDYEKLFKKDGAQKQFDTLLKATKGQGMKLIQKGTSFWVPILEFEWKLNGKNAIEGIETDGEYDPALIKKFVKDGVAKVFDVKASLLTSINRQITTGRSGANFLDRDKGYNLIVARDGDGRDTKYTAIKDEQMPMPEEFYGDNTIDLHKIAKAGMVTNKYIEDVLSNYFDGTPLPENPEYRFPELREELKSGAKEEEQPTRSRRRASLTEKEPEPTTAVEEGPEPTQAVEDEAPKTRTRAGKTEEKTEPTRRRRSLVDDVASE